MNILFLSRKALPHLGGVENHINLVSRELTKKGHTIKIISEDDVKYPHIKLIGLLYIWFWFFKNRDLMKKADVIHIHDVFVWYLPFKFLYPHKKVFTTFHGWEAIYPIPYLNKLQKKIAAKLSNGTISIGKFVNKFYGIKTDKILYGGVSMYRYIDTKTKNSYLFVGRLEPDTGLTEFLKWISRLDYGYTVEFVGDGSLRKECEKFGKVYGFTDPTPFYKKAETVVPSGYLTYLEAVGYGCKIKTFYSTPLKKEYWAEILKLKKYMSWEDVANEYLKLWEIK